MIRRLLLWGTLGYCLWCLPALSPAGPSEALYDPLISSTVQHYDLPPALIKAVIHCESAFNSRAQSPRGAQGLMQLMPGTQALLGVSDAFNPQHNIAAGVRYLAGLKHTFGGDVALMLAAYNAGPHAVIAAGYTVPPFAETQQYVHCVLAAWQDYHRAGVEQSAARGLLRSPVPRPTAATTLHLKATAIDRYGGLAFINDQILTIGQSILGYTVVHIAEGRVDLQRQEQKLSLALEDRR
jgi:hypothetical protein